MRAPVTSSRLYPLFTDLRGRTVLVVGGGVVSRRKVESLRDTGARIVVGAPQLDPVLANWASTGELTHRQGPFHSAWLEGTGMDRVWLVIAATDDADINRAVAEACEACGIWVNVVDDTDNARFHVPALIQRGPLQIAISSGGGAPMLARLLRESLEKQIDGSYGALAELLTRKREQIRNRWPALRDRRRGYARLLAGPLQALLRKGNHLAAERAFDAALKSTADTATPTTGSVVLVGAGPGDPGLLTLRALRAMNEADVILHDRLVSADVLQLARRDAECIEVGKQAGNHHATQEQINALLVEHALAGRRVVRLKGGDPFVFGRGGEELEVLQTHGIAFEVVPGITAAIACAAYAGIPLTHRDHAQSLHIVTAHCKASLDTLDWPALAQSRQTLAVYMGVGMLGTLQARLLAQGLAATTPFALIENGSRPDQRIVTGTLAELAGRATIHAVQSPALLIMGEVAAFANRLHWFGAAPLTGESSPAPANTLALAVAA